MAQNLSNLPYFNITPSAEEKTAADFLLRKFMARIKRKNPQHYLVQPGPYKSLKFIKNNTKKHPYFLKFDIRLYYPSISHQILIRVLPEIYQNILKTPPSRRFKKCLKNEIAEFLAKSPYGKGIPIGSRLSFALAGLFLLSLDWEIPCPFLRQNDDYLIFCKSRGETEKLLKNIILPKLKELGLEINEKKLGSGKLHQDKVNFIGFEFYSGYIRISEEKIEGFKDRIIKITHLTKKRSYKAVIKLLNNKILGFGHYYKFAHCKQDFERIDAFIRQRLRRYLIKNKDQKQKIGNLLLTNQELRNLGLKSLLKIKEKYASKKRHVFPKNATNRKQIGKSKKSDFLKKSDFWTDNYAQKAILKQLQELASLIRRIEKRITKIEKKLENS